MVSHAFDVPLCRFCGKCVWLVHVPNGAHCPVRGNELWLKSWQ